MQKEMVVVAMIMICLSSAAYADRSNSTANGSPPNSFSFNANLEAGRIKIKHNRSNIISCIESERQALLEFKQELQDPSKRLASWVGEDCCKWNGVICDNTTGHVDKLLLKSPLSFDDHGMQSHLLGGKLNPSLLNLKQLRELDLSNNDFGDMQFPEFLGSLRSLRYLDLSKARFEGRIPNEYGNLTNLIHLDLHGSPTDTSYGYAEKFQLFSNLSSLQYLDMSNVNLWRASDWLEVTRSLSSLEVLRLSGCLLVYENPPVYHVNLSSLMILDLSKNLNPTYPKWIFNLRSLVYLDLSQNQISGSIPESIENMTSLKHLDLYRNNFNSSISNWLCRLSHLEYLNLGQNNLRGPISCERKDMSRNDTVVNLQGLYNLKEIDLSLNEWNQDISQVLEIFSGSRHKLEILSVYGSKVSGHLTNQIGEFKNLRMLLLSSNSISGSIPASLGSLSSLEALDLSRNQFNGTLPESFGKLAKIQTLDISYNSLEGIVSEAHFANTTQLINLAASGNLLKLEVPSGWVPPFHLYELEMGSWLLGPQFPSWLHSQQYLHQLDISNTKLSGDVPFWFWNFSSQFSYLNISHNQLHGRILNLSVMDTIDLSNNHFEGPLPFVSSHVNSLDLSDNLFSGSMNQFLCYKMDVPMNMNVLRLAKNNLSGEIPNCWSKYWTKLAIINLSYNNIVGKIPSSMSSLVFLQSLHLSNNGFFGRLPSSLANWTSLITLDLRDNKFNGSIPIWIGEKLLKLRILSLRSNKFDGHIPHQLCMITSLQILDLAANHLSGPIPKCFNNITVLVSRSSNVDEFTYDQNDTKEGEIIQTLILYNFIEDVLLVNKEIALEYTKTLPFVTSIDLSSNDLSGQIPSEITSLSGLFALNLSHNILTGNIPLNLGNMTTLESIDLSVNQLSGQIPETISKLDFLSYLNLSFNKLKGRIPTSTKIQGFDPSSFIGNNLCGPPVTQNCTKVGVIPTTENKSREEEDDDWSSSLYLGMGVGFAAGFLGVCCSIFSIRTWRHAFFRFFDSIYHQVCLATILKLRWLHKSLGQS